MAIWLKLKTTQVIAFAVMLAVLLCEISVAQIPPPPSITLSRVNFVYPPDGSVKIELSSDAPIRDYQITTIGLNTVVRISGAVSRLLPSYLVRNSFDVQVHTGSITNEMVSGVEITIIVSAGVS